MQNEVITLITVYGPSYDVDGFETGASTNEVQCFASVKTVTYKEYYEASRTDEQVTDIFVVDERDYNLSMYFDGTKKVRPTLIRYDGVLYKIIRRYKSATNGNHVIELTCKEVE